MHPPPTAAAIDRAPIERARAALADRVDRCRKAYGAVAAIVQPSGTEIVSHGRLARDDDRAPDADTVFELGCLLYTFDAVLLCDAVERGEVSLSDRVDSHLPSDVRLPQRGEPMVLRHLVMHTSGLPGRRTAIASHEAIHTEAGLYRMLSAIEPVRDVGVHYEDSRLGATLLRHVLARRLGGDYEGVLATRVFRPLGLESTSITPRPDLTPRQATGHDDRLDAVSCDPLELRSTARDLSRFLAVCLGIASSPLDAAIARTVSMRMPCGPKTETAFGWQIEMHGGDEVICQDGHSQGSRAWIGYRPRAARGIALLSNAATVGGLLDIGYHLLDERYPLLPDDAPMLRPSAAPGAAAVPVEVLRGHTGRYQLTPNVMIVITCEGDRLFAERTGKGKVAIAAESPVDFFCERVDFYELPADTRITFQRDHSGATVGMTLRQRGQEIWLPRVEASAVGVWFGEIPTVVDPAILDAYVGRYRLGPAVGGYRLGPNIVTVTRQADQLIAALDDTLTVPLMAKNHAEFFIANDIVNLQFRFETDSTGRAIGLVGTYDGITRRAVRVDADACDL